jgi:hypothetical protein
MRNPKIWVVILEYYLTLKLGVYGSFFDHPRPPAPATPHHVSPRLVRLLCWDENEWRPCGDAGESQKRERRHRWRVVCKCNVGTLCWRLSAYVYRTTTLSSSLVSLSRDTLERQRVLSRAETPPPRQCHVRMARASCHALNFRRAQTYSALH